MPRSFALLVACCVTAAVLALAAAPAAAQAVEVEVQDAFIELRTAPGPGYPVFYIAERGDVIELVKRRTSWVKVRVPRGTEGWVHATQLAGTLGAGGEPLDLPSFTLEDYTASRWEAGFQYGDFGGASALSAFAARRLTPSLALEFGVAQVFGDYGDSLAAHVAVTHTVYPDDRVSPILTLGTGILDTDPQTTLVEHAGATDTHLHVGAGLRVYLTSRLVFRADYKRYVVFTSSDDNEEIGQWKAGFSLFF